MNAALVLDLVVFGAACWEKTDDLLGVTDVAPAIIVVRHCVEGIGHQVVGSVNALLGELHAVGMA